MLCSRVGAWSGGSAPGGCLVGGVPGLGVPGVGGAWSGGGLLPGEVPGGDHPPMATAAGGTHPTGMHSCFMTYFYSAWGTMAP